MIIKKNAAAFPQNFEEQGKEPSFFHQSGLHRR